jgi:hypothetical protein
MAGVFIMVLIGFVANRPGRLPSESGKYCIIKESEEPQCHPLPEE